MLLLHLCTQASGLIIYFCSYISYTFKELMFPRRQTRVHELNKNGMKLELVSCHVTTILLKVELGYITHTNNYYTGKDQE